MTLQTIFASAAGLFGTISAVDHCLAAAKKYLPNSTGQLVKALLTGQPIKTPAVAQQTIKGAIEMSFLANLRSIVEEAEELGARGLAALDKITLFAEKAAPVAASLAPLAGSAAPAVAAGATLATELAPLAHEAIQEAEALHLQGDGQGPQPVNAN